MEYENGSTRATRHTDCRGNYEVKLKIKNKQSSIVFDY